MLSAAMKAGLKDAGFNNTACVVIDLQNMPAEQKAGLHFMFGTFPTYADIKGNLDKVQSLTVKVNEPKGKFNVFATLTCSDKASAAVVKTIGDASLAYMNTKANEEVKIKLPDGFDKYVTGARTALKAIKVSSAGAKVTASVEVEPEVAVYAMTGWVFVVGVGGVKEVPKESKAKDVPNQNPNK